MQSDTQIQKPDGFDLKAEMRRLYDGTKITDPGAFADKLFERIPPEEYGAALRGILREHCQVYFSQRRMRDRPEHEDEDGTPLYDAWSRPDKPGDTEFDRWVRFTAKAIDYPERIAPEVLRGMREKMGDLFFRQEYGGEFLATVNQVFSEEDILRAFTPTVRPLVPEINAAAAAEKPPTQEQLMVMAAAGVSAPGIAALTTVPWPRGW